MGMTLDELTKIKSSLEFGLRLVKTNGGYDAIQASLWIINREIKLQTMNVRKSAEEDPMVDSK